MGARCCSWVVVRRVFYWRGGVFIRNAVIQRVKRFLAFYRGDNHIVRFIARGPGISRGSYCAVGSCVRDYGGVEKPCINAP